jgi:hypothetical protein
MSSSTTTKISVVLKEPGDWDEWMLIIKSMAKRGNVKEFVNLNASEPKELERPEIPTFRTVKPDAVSLADLDQNQQKQLAMLREDFKEISRTYREKREAMDNIDQHIMTTVDRQNILYLDGADTVYQKLIALKERLAPTDRARKLEVKRKYRNLLQGPVAQQPENWLQQYERAYVEATKIKLPEVQDEQPLYDLLDALRTVDMAYVAGREAVIADKLEDGRPLPSVKKQLENYRNYLRTIKARTTRGSSHTAFATLQGSPPESPESEQQQQQEKQNLGSRFSDCLCGETHKFKDCPYLIEELRGAGWVPNEEIKHRIDDKISKAPKLKIAVERVQKEAKEMREKPPIEKPLERPPEKNDTSRTHRSFAVGAF